jgi:hypothetical protein
MGHLIRVMTRPGAVWIIDVLMQPDEEEADD